MDGQKSAPDAARTALLATVLRRGPAPQPPALSRGRRRERGRCRPAPDLACSTDERAGSDGRLNVLLLIVDSLRPDHVGAYGSPQIQTPTIDALAARGLRFTRAFPEAMVTVPARRSIFSAKRIFPYRNWKPNPEIGTSPGWLPIDDPQRTFTTVLRDEGYWNAQVSDNPFIAFMKAFEPFRETFDQWTTIVGQSGFYEDPDSIPMSTVKQWLPPILRDERYMPGMRKYLANSGGGKDEEETVLRPALQGRRRAARPGQAPPAVRAHGRLVRPPRALEPAAQVPRHVRRPRL